MIKDLEICLTNTNSTFAGQNLHKQVGLQRYRTQASGTATVRYRNDYLTIWTGEDDKIQQLLEFLNSLDEGLTLKRLGGQFDSPFPPVVFQKMHLLKRG